jgi:hypothetical protein
VVRSPALDDLSTVLSKKVVSAVARRDNRAALHPGLVLRGADPGRVGSEPGVLGVVQPARRQLAERAGVDRKTELPKTAIACGVAAALLDPGWGARHSAVSRPARNTRLIGAESVAHSAGRAGGSAGGAMRGSATTTVAIVAALAVLEVVMTGCGPSISG